MYVWTKPPIQSVSLGKYPNIMANEATSESWLLYVFLRRERGERSLYVSF